LGVITASPAARGEQGASDDGKNGTGHMSDVFHERAEKGFGLLLLEAAVAETSPSLRILGFSNNPYFAH